MIKLRHVRHAEMGIIPARGVAGALPFCFGSIKRAIDKMNLPAGFQHPFQRKHQGLQIREILDRSCQNNEIEM